MCISIFLPFMISTINILSYMSHIKKIIIKHYSYSQSLLSTLNSNLISFIQKKPLLRVWFISFYVCSILYTYNIYLTKFLDDHIKGNIVQKLLELEVLILIRIWQNKVSLCEDWLTFKKFVGWYFP